MWAVSDDDGAQTSQRYELSCTLVFCVFLMYSIVALVFVLFCYKFKFLFVYYCNNKCVCSSYQEHLVSFWACYWMTWLADLLSDQNAFWLDRYWQVVMIDSWELSALNGINVIFYVLLKRWYVCVIHDTDTIRSSPNGYMEIYNRRSTVQILFGKTVTWLTAVMNWF